MFVLRPCSKAQTVLPSYMYKAFKNTEILHEACSARELEQPQSRGQEKGNHATGEIMYSRIFTLAGEKR